MDIHNTPLLIHIIIIGYELSISYIEKFTSAISKFLQIDVCLFFILYKGAKGDLPSEDRLIQSLVILSL